MNLEGFLGMRFLWEGKPDEGVKTGATGAVLEVFSTMSLTKFMGGGACGQESSWRSSKSSSNFSPGMFMMVIVTRW